VHRLLLLSLGSNLGDRSAFLEFARLRIREELGEIHLASEIEETDGFGVSGHPPYLNQVIALHTELSPEEILYITQNIEREAGRDGKGLLIPRSLDIDIIALGDLIHRESELIIPHKSMHQRAFVLKPLCEILPAWEHPSLKKTAIQLLRAL
jgi:2-amino-4-hydroxy-6-hydroxymethyldihydropteridine diphosphokinase